MTSPTKYKYFQFFKSKLYKTSGIRRRFEQLSSLTGWRILVLQSPAKKVAQAGVLSEQYCELYYISFTVAKLQ